MELVLILVGVAVVFISALLVFVLSLRMMKESSYEEIAAENARRQEEIERELGIVRTKDIKKELNKKKKEKKAKTTRELDQPEESDEQDSGLDIIETSAQRKGKKSQKIASSVETTQLVEKSAEKADSRKKGKASQPSSGGGVKNAKARTAGKSDLDDFGTFEPEAPFTVAESRNKKKKQTVQTENGVSSGSSAKQNAFSKSVPATPGDQTTPKVSVDVSTGKQNTPKFPNTGRPTTWF